MNIFKSILLLSISFIFLSSFDGLEKKLPSVELKNLEGKKVNIDEYSNNGKLTIVSFWATWCTPCKRELDAYGEYAEEWASEYNAEIVAITIDNARQLAKVKPMVAQKGWSFDILSDVNQDLMKQLNFQLIPQTYVLDQDGNIVYDHSGYAPGDELEIEDLLIELSKK
jgi:cytochrome c biogenesis protein CcmG/thiol:disulfide interchange protein DsbE